MIYFEKKNQSLYIVSSYKFLKLFSAIFKRNKLKETGQRRQLQFHNLNWRLFFLRGLFSVSLDGLSERGTTLSLG